jgi:hypothetical protein
MALEMDRFEKSTGFGLLYMGCMGDVGSRAH